MIHIKVPKFLWVAIRKLSTTYRLFRKNLNSSLTLSHVSNCKRNKPLCQGINDKHNVDIGELYVHFALQMLIVIIQKPLLKSYFTKKSYLGHSSFYKTISQDRFKIKNKFLHFSDNSQLEHYEGNKKLFKIDPVMKHLNYKYKSSYKMGENRSVDESLTLWKLRLAIKHTFLSRLLNLV